MKSTVITHRQLKIAYSEAGEGIPLVLLHAFPLDRQMWKPQLRDLATGYHVIAPDFPGFGESGTPTCAFTVDLAADIVADFLDSIGITGEVVLGGCSMGGYVALAFARRQPQRLKALLLIDTKADPDDEKAKENRVKTEQLAREKGSAAVIETMLPRMLGDAISPEHALVVETVRQLGSRQTSTAIVTALQLLLERPDANPALPRISVPTLVIVGEQDKITPLSDAQNMVDKIPHAQLAVIPGGGHLCNLEVPEAFNEALRAFLIRI